MPARLVTYVDDTPMEVRCATCKVEIEGEDDPCPNGCDDLEENEETINSYKQVTDFATICQILSSLYSNLLEQGLPEEEHFRNFMDQEGLGLLLAFAITTGLVEANNSGEQYLSNVWELFLASLGLTDSGWISLGEILNAWIN